MPNNNGNAAGAWGSIVRGNALLGLALTAVGAGILALTATDKKHGWADKAPAFGAGVVLAAAGAANFLTPASSTSGVPRLQTGGCGCSSNGPQL